uniref:Galectin n=2 Tax=Parascaris univalens TaxID=6257 RepID=A0A915AF23_PARUN
MSQSVVMNNLERLFALEPRHFPLPILPFRSDFNGYGVGAKVRLEATPYASAQSGFEICLLESGDDIALFANVSFDSEGRSAIDVKSRFAAKWSPTVRHIGIGIAIDRAFTLEVTVNSSEFVVIVDGFKVTEFVKRCDDVKAVLIWGSIIVKEITIIPSLLYYTPPPEYSAVPQKMEFDISSALNKLALIPTAPEVTPSNTLFNKFSADESNELKSRNAVLMGKTPEYEDKILRLDPPMERIVPPRPPPPTVKNRLTPSYSQNDMCLFSKTKSCAGAAGQGAKLSFQNSEDREAEIMNPAQCRRSGYNASERIVDYHSNRRVHFDEASEHQNVATHFVPSSTYASPHLNAVSTSNHIQKRNRQARCGSCENVSDDTQPSMRNSRSDYRRSSRHQRAVSAVNIYSPIISTHQLQEKTEAVYNAAKNFLKANFAVPFLRNKII